MRHLPNFQSSLNNLHQFLNCVVDHVMSVGAEVEVLVIVIVCRVEKTIGATPAGTGILVTCNDNTGMWLRLLQLLRTLSLAPPALT